MNIIITQQLSNGTVVEAQSDDGRYQWFCGQDDRLHDAATGRSIYRMAYLKLEGFGSDPLPDDVAADVREFWDALTPLVEAGEEQAHSLRVKQEGEAAGAREALHKAMDSAMSPEDR